MSGFITAPMREHARYSAVNRHQLGNWQAITSFWPTPMRFDDKVALVHFLNRLNEGMAKADLTALGAAASPAECSESDS